MEKSQILTYSLPTSIKRAKTDDGTIILQDCIKPELLGEPIKILAETLAKLEKTAYYKAAYSSPYRVEDPVCDIVFKMNAALNFLSGTKKSCEEAN